MEIKNKLGNLERKKTVTALALITVVFAGIYIGLSATPVEDSGFNQTNQEEAISDNSIIISRDQVEGEVVPIEVQGMTVDKARPTISEEDAIEFINNEENDLEISFDRDYDAVGLETGDSVILDINQITYYTISPQDSEISYRNIERGINVQ